MEAKTIENDLEYLRQVSKEIEYNDIDLKHDIEVLKEYCINHDVMAMASVQLAIPKRLIYLKNTNIDIINKMQYNKASLEESNINESRVLINPVIKKRVGLTMYWEACASCLDNMGLVKRPYKIYVDYLDSDFNKHSKIFEGFEATVLSHEYDHLNGILHMDRAEQVKVLDREKRKEFRQTHGYEIINKNDLYIDKYEK